MHSVPLETSLPDRFRVDTLLAAGDRCSVYRAWDQDAQRTVVLKQFRSGDGALYLRESAAGLSMSHPNLLTCREALYPNAASPCLVFDYMAAGTLRSRIDREGKLPLHEAQRCTENLLAGLIHLHQSGWIHRDLKPDNIYLTDAGGCSRYLIGDFGSACTVAEVAAGAAGAGTPAYSAPETRLRLTTARSDLYSLGMLALEATTGKLPFAPSMAAAREAQRCATLDLSGVEDPDWRDFLTMLLEPEPTRRCPDAATALRVLEGLGGSDRMTPLPLRLSSRSTSGSNVITHFTLNDHAAPKSIRLLRQGSRHALLLEHPAHCDLLHLPLPCIRRSLPVQHDVVQLSNEQIAFIAGNRLQLFDVHRGNRSVLGELPTRVHGGRHDGKQALWFDDAGYHLLNLARQSLHTARLSGDHAQAMRPALCLFEGGGFAASGGRLNRHVTFHDQQALPGQSIALPDSVLALVPDTQGFLHALTLSTAGSNRYTLWQLHRFLEPRRFQIDHDIVAWSQCGNHLDLLSADGKVGRVRQSHIDTLGRLPMTPHSITTFGVTPDGDSLAVASQDDGHHLITLMQLN